jgi:arylsulfatase
MQRPNVLLLYTDQQRWDTIRYGGNPHIITPNLDALASQGVMMENAYCNNPVCMPSRQSMLSGLYPSTLGCTTNGIEMREDVWTLPRILQSYGYATANIGKLHYKNHSNRNHRDPHPRYGFDTLILSDEPGCYDDAYIQWVTLQAPEQVENCRVSTPPAWQGKPVVKHPRNTHEPYIFEGPETLTHSAFVADEMCMFIQQHNPNQPFFGIAGFYAPHAPLNPPAKFVDMYNPQSLPLPNFDTPGSDVPWTGMHLDDDHWRKIKAYYYAIISHVDDQIGRILQTLKETNQLNNTIIIFTSDHGEHLGDHGLIQKGPPGLISCTHVPLIFSSPNLFSPQIITDLIESVDIAPTVLELCGVQVPPFFQGRSFSNLLLEKEYQPRSSVFIEFKDPFRSSWKTVRTKDYTYSRYWRNESPEQQCELLYDLNRDPHEQTNLSHNNHYTSTLAEMREKLLARWFEVENPYPLRTGQY